MRKLLRIVIFIVITIIINICLYGLFTVNGYSYIYDFAKKINTRSVEVNDETEEYVYFNNQLSKNMVFLLKNSPKTQKEILFIIDYIKYLNKETGIKYIFDEVGFSAGQMINIYLQTGDETFLDQIFASAGDNETYSDLRRFYYKKLYEYNVSLPETARLKLFGIDTEFTDKSHSLLYFEYLTGKVHNKIVPAKIGNILNGNRNDSDIYFNNLKKSLDQNEALYKELFVEDYFNFSCLVDNYFTDKSDNNIRQQIMAVNFVKIYNKNLRGKYFGVFADTGFIEKIFSIYENVYNKISVLKVWHELWFDNIDKKGDIFAVNNKYLKYFIKYREFVYKINGREATDFYDRNNDTFFIVNENTEVK